MQESDIRVVRGVSIASIVLSVLAMLGCALLIALFAAGGVFASDPSNLDGYVDYRDDLGTTHGIDAQYGLDAQETSSLVAGVFGFLGAFSGFGLVLCAVSLIAGIVGLRNSRNPQKAGGIVGWSIAGAICSILMCRVVSCVLLIVNAVYASRLRRAAQNPATYAQPAYGYAPQQGYAQPTAGYAPQQPVMPQQPCQAVPPQPQQPVAPVAPQQPGQPQKPQDEQMK